MPHPKDVAWFPRPQRPTDRDRSGSDARCRQGASCGVRSAEGQDCRTTGSTPSRATRSSDDQAATDKPRPSSAAREQSSSNNDVPHRWSSSTAPVRTSSQPRPPVPRRSLSSPSAVPPRTTPRTQLDKELRDRLERLRLRRADVTQNKQIVHELCSDILEELKGNSGRSLGHWEIMNSGSYYDKTKV